MLVLMLCLLCINNTYAQTKNITYKSSSDINVSELAGKIAPGFTLKSLDNEQISLESYKGKIVILSFWHINCGQCWDEIPSLNRIAKKYKGEVVILALTENSNSELEKKLELSDKGYLIKGKKDKRYINYIVVPNAKELVHQYEVQYFPTNFIIDQQGFIVKALPYIKSFSDETGDFVSNQVLDEQISALIH